MKSRREKQIDQMNEEELEKVRLAYEEQSRLLPDMQDIKVLEKLSKDLLTCIKSITDWHQVEDTLLPDKSTLIQFFEHKEEMWFPQYEIESGRRCQKWKTAAFLPPPLRSKCMHVSEHIYEWLTLLGTIAKSINSPLLSEFTYCRGVFGSAYCEIGGLEHTIAVNVAERIFRANASLAAEVAFTKDVRYPYRVFFDVEVTEDQEDVENCEDEDEAFERDMRNVTKIYNELYGNSIHDIAALESGFTRLVSEIKENKLSPQSTLWLRLQDSEMISHSLLMRTKIYSLHFSDKKGGHYWHEMPEHQRKMKLIDTITEYCKLSEGIARQSKEPSLQLTYAEMSHILTEYRQNLETGETFSHDLSRQSIDYLSKTLVRTIPLPTAKTVILADIGNSASENLSKSIKNAKRPKKRGMPYGKRNPLIHKDRIAVLTEIDRRYEGGGLSLGRIIETMKKDSAYSARMQNVGINGWRNYYYNWKRTHKGETDCNL